MAHWEQINDETWRLATRSSDGTLVILGRIRIKKGGQHTMYATRGNQPEQYIGKAGSLDVARRTIDEYQE